MEDGCKTLKIEGHNFCCGVLVKKGIVEDSAPILKWVKGKTEGFLRSYCIGKSWRCDEVEAKQEK